MNRESRFIAIFSLLVLCFASSDEIHFPIYSKPNSVPLSFYQDLLKLTSALIPSNKCTESFKELIKYPLNIQALINIFLFTGKRLNDLGDYRGCINNTANKYIELKTYGFSLGLCLPLSCTLDSIDQIKPIIIFAIEKLANIKIDIKETKWVDVEEENKALRKVNTGTWLFLGAMGSFIFFNIVGTIIHQACNIKSSQIFSIPKNFDNLLIGPNPVDPNLDAFNAIKIIGIMWVICGHTYFYDSLAPTYNLNTFQESLLHSFHHSFVKTSSFAGDVFFFMSGFMASLSFYRAFNTISKFSISVVITSYFRRYIRQLPLLIFNIAFLIYGLPYIRDRPFHYDIKSDINNCSINCIWNILYVNNFIADKTCMSWTWYLANDFQFYLLSPFFVLGFIVSFKLGIIILSGTALASIIATSIIYNHYGLHMSYLRPITDDYLTKFYYKPYCRIVPYLLGILYQFIYQDAKKTNKESKNAFFYALEQFIVKKDWAKYIFYFLGLGIIYVTIHIIYFFDNYEGWSQGLATLYEISSRPMFILGLMIIMYPPITGHGPALVDCLGHPMLCSLGRITYGTYLINPLLIYFMMGYSVTGHYTGHSWMLYNWSTFVLFSYAFSYVITTLFESPIIQILRITLDKVRKSYEKAKECIIEQDSIDEN